MVDQKTLHELVRLGIQAPSGDNAQPWRFALRDSSILVYNCPENDRSIYNHGQIASYIAIGALIENIEIGATQFGLAAKASLFPDSSLADLVARIALEDSAVAASPLIEAIPRRCSNRQPYQGGTLGDTEVSELLDAGNDSSAVRALIAQGDAVSAIAKAASINERIVLENKAMHSFLFDHITWDAREDDAVKGFFVGTLELKGPQKAAFRIFRHWPILSLLNRLGASRLVSSDNAKLYATSSAIIGFAIADTKPQSYVEAGMAMERVWLTAAKIGLSVQPLAGIALLMQQISGSGSDLLSKAHAALTKEAYQEIASALNAPPDSTIPMLLRIGRSEPASARTQRREPIIVQE